jgi:hypothetical protein
VWFLADQGDGVGAYRTGVRCGGESVWRPRQPDYGAPRN